MKNNLHANVKTFLLVEELQCLAVWKEGSSRYLVGRVQHSHATSNEDRFRCFVYEKTSSDSENSDGIDYRVAQSGDATCNGLFSATEGSRTMTLKRGRTKDIIFFKKLFMYKYSSSSLYEQVSFSFVVGDVQSLAYAGLLFNVQFSSQKFYT